MCYGTKTLPDRQPAGFAQDDEAGCYLQCVSSMVSRVRCPVQCTIRRAPFSSQVMFSLGDVIQVGSIGVSLDV
jgi:hypothetical protein